MATTFGTKTGPAIEVDDTGLMQISQVNISRFKPGKQNAQEEKRKQDAEQQVSAKQMHESKFCRLPEYEAIFKPRNDQILKLL